MRREPLQAPARGRGLSLLGLLAWLSLLALVAVAALRVLPTVNEYFTIRRLVERLGAAGGSPNEIRAAFDRQREAEVGLGSITGRDLSIGQEDGQLVVRFAYDKEIELVPPVYLLIKYQGRSR